MKPVFVLSNPDFAVNPSQFGSSLSMAGVPYPYADPYAGSFLSAYGPPQALMVGMTPTRVPLPLDLTDDGPIYVNAKQYHGILRRRKSRAKQEAKNKLIKSRKPYLHESRHLHALNRVRGSGGRFLSKKQLQQSNSTSTASSSHCMSTDSVKPNQNKDKHDFDHSGFDDYVTGMSTHSDITSVSDGGSSGVMFRQQADRRFPGSSPHVGGAMQCSGGFLQQHGGSQHCASVVRFEIGTNMTM
ncbi:hypothetical protein UlMin_022007 [Ulmus minor]